MFRIVNTAALALTALSLSGTAALAQSASEGRGGWFIRWFFSNWSEHQHAASTTRRAVPEIDAANGLLAVAAVVAALALAYELKRRRKA